MSEIALPLTAAQTGVWFAQQLAPESPVFHVAAAIEIDGPLDLDVFDRALTATVAETETLRTRFAEGPDGPYQIIVDEPGWALGRRDLSQQPDPDAAAYALIQADLAKPVDPMKGPLTASTLYILGRDRHLWYRRAHHLVNDGHGSMINGHRVAQVYTALAGGHPVPDDGRMGRLQQLVEDDLAYQHSAQHQADRDFWLSRITGDCDAVSLAGRPSGTPRGRLTHTGLLEQETVTAFAAAAEQAGTTWARLAIAAVATYLYQRTGHQTMTLGLPVAARMDAVSRTIPGMVSNMIPLMCTVDPARTLGDCANDVAAQLRSILPHQRFRLEELRRELGLRRRLFGPLVNVVPFYGDLDFAGSRGMMRAVARGPFQDMSIWISREDQARSMRVEIDADPDLYGTDDLAEHHDGLLSILRTVAADMRPRVADLTPSRSSRPPRSAPPRPRSAGTYAGRTVSRLESR